MMDEKTMVSDTLTGINGELKMYAEYISQSEDPKLKQTLKQMRNKAEAAQEQIYQIAREKSYYVPAAPASKEEIEQVIDSLEDDTLRQLMKYRYINLMKWEEIAVQMFYGYQWVCKLHGRALAKIQINRR